jgi:tRNA (guanine-N7-)-methyltransferase
MLPQSTDILPESSVCDATEAKEPRTAHNIKSFVIREGRKTAAQQRAYDALAGLLLLPFENKELDYAAVFGNSNPVVAEIGFGMGIATSIIAKNHPGINYLGIEVHRPGIGKLLWEIEQNSLANIRIIEYDAVEVFENMIPPGSLEGIHLFFPDPWPKKRHHKRRLVKRPFTDTLAAKLKPSGYLYMVTDWEDYALWALDELEATKELCNTAEHFAPPKSWRPQTRFEAKGLAKNHQVKELFFEKR